MKKVLLTMTMLLLLGTNVQVVAQKHRHTPQQELVDSTSKDAVEAFSDTTTVATPAGAVDDDWTKEDDADERIEKHLSRIVTSWDSKDALGVLLVLGVLLIIFVLAPVLIIVALFYFINKNRKEKMRLAQMAMQQGQPIPDQLLNEKPIDVDDEYQKGMRQCFVGVGLMIFLGYAAGEVGFGIGALVFCIGLGKVFASKTAQKQNIKNNELNENQYD
ncbi:MAG: hypothetical protein IJJ62_02225 [Prevotella sp.]|nr:hypothetical protein [Prevotella sp.]